MRGVRLALLVLSVIVAVAITCAGFQRPSQESTLSRGSGSQAAAGPASPGAEADAGTVGPSEGAAFTLQLWHLSPGRTAGRDERRILAGLPLNAMCWWAGLVVRTGDQAHCLVRGGPLLGVGAALAAADPGPAGNDPVAPTDVAGAADAESEDDRSGGISNGRLSAEEVAPPGSATSDTPESSRSRLAGLPSWPVIRVDSACSRLLERTDGAWEVEAAILVGFARCRRHVDCAGLQIDWDVPVRLLSAYARLLTDNCRRAAVCRARDC